MTRQKKQATRKPRRNVLSTQPDPAAHPAKKEHTLDYVIVSAALEMATNPKCAPLTKFLGDAAHAFAAAQSSTMSPNYALKEICELVDRKWPCEPSDVVDAVRRHVQSANELRDSAEDAAIERNLAR